MDRLADYLKLALSDDREMTDSAYETLSVILHENHLVDCAYDSGLVQIINLFDLKGYTFPVSLAFLKNEWEKQNVSFNFIKMLGSLVKEGLFSLKKVKSENYLKSQDITMTEGEAPDVTGNYIAVYATDNMKGLMEQFRKVFHPESPVTEGASFWSGKNKKLADAIMRASSLLNKGLNITLTEESYTESTDGGHTGDRLNMIISNTSKYNCKDSDIQRLAKKYLGKLGCFMGVEAYKESDTEVFLGIDIHPGMVNTFKDIPPALYNLFDDLEVNHV